jgi:hypothetical protein
MGDVVDQSGNRRLLSAAINPLDRVLNQALALGIEAAGSLTRAGPRRDERARHRLRAVGRDEAIDPRAL